MKKIGAKFVMRLESLASKIAVISMVIFGLNAEIALAQTKSFDESPPDLEAPEKTEITWKLSLNPTWGRSLDIDDDPITNQNAFKLTLNLKQPIVGESNISATLGAQADPKFASTVVVPGAGIFGQVSLGTRIPVGTPSLDKKIRDSFNLSTSYKVTRGFRDDDNALTDDDFTDHQLGAEAVFTNVRYVRAQTAELGAPLDPSAYWKATAGYGRVLSNNNIRDKYAIVGKFDWNYDFYEKYPDINLQGSIERSRFDELISGARRRETLFTLFGGLDLKKYAPFDGVKKAVAGLSLSRLESTIADADDNRIAFQITIDLGS